ncbi:MAG: phage tail protein [Rhodococcus erythropolis]
MAGTLIELESYTGEWFTLLGPGKGDRGVFLDQDPSGFYDEEPIEAIYNSHAFELGATFGGIRVNKKDVLFKVHVRDTKDATWLENNSAWQRALSFTKDSKLWIETDGSRRYLKIRKFKSNELTPKIDPNKVQYGLVVMTCVAPYPRWIENDGEFIWTAQTDSLNGTTCWGTFPVKNPTDTEVWLKYELQAYPGAEYILPDYSFGDNRLRRKVEDANKQITLAKLLAGEHLLVDTDESPDFGQFNSSIDTQFYIRMKGKTFTYPIPAGKKRTLLPIGVRFAPAGVGVKIRTPKTWSSSLVLP